MLERDSYRCLDCGRAGKLEVHHVQHLKDGGTNDPENLRTLCTDCHKLAHQQPLGPEQQALGQLVRDLAVTLPNLNRLFTVSGSSSTTQQQSGISRGDSSHGWIPTFRKARITAYTW